MADLDALTIGVLGGTGPQGRGLALRFVQSGLAVILGSRSAEKGAAAAAELAARIGKPVQGADNLGCAERSDIVIVAVPWDATASSSPASRTPSPARSSSTA